ncbi:MAG: Serine/threonine protein kinase PrkC, regulator of stationary phase [Myxococcaceae bacterium]|nr:Serine/threonine protein kinase PrkC, regulator of stationary phase [Myxococcaceae bacterium]
MDPKTSDLSAPTIVEKLELSDTIAAPSARVSLTSLEVDDNRYERGSLLGRGGMGEVHLCTDKWIGRQIALKTSLPASRDSSGLARFVREAKVQARLEHPSIVPVYDVGRDDDGTVWFTMKRVRGKSLEAVIEALAAGDAQAHAEFSRRKLLTAFVAVCYAVAFAHEHGVIHRDLKPANIMLGRFGEVSVLDWGIAKVSGVADDPIAAEAVADLAGAREGGTQQGAVIGTPGYIAPEQVRGDSNGVGPAADVYALGAILFEILALAPLNRGTSVVELLTAALKDADARPSARGKDVPPELDEICTRATLLDETKRMQSARELAEAVERYLDGDRDVERRRQLAAEHTARASAIPARGTALLELGRALALDPSNTQARDLMAHLLITVPDEVPPEAREELAVEHTRARRRAAREGGMRSVLWCAFMPLVFWMGVRDWVLTFVILAFMVATGGWAWWMARRPRLAASSMLALLVTNSMTIALVSALFGPFILVPALAATNGMFFAMVLERRYRPLAILASVMAVAAPFVFELMHLVPAAYELDAGLESFSVKARTAYFPAVPTQVTLLLTAIAGAIIPVTMVGRMRDALTSAEQRLFLQAWHLRATLPADTHAPLVKEYP